MVVKRISFILFAVLFVFFAGTISAQTNAQELRIGSNIQGYLSEGAQLWYTVRTPQNSMLTVETTSSFDTYLEFYDSNLNLITENDDGGEDLNARIETFITANRTYYVKLRGFNDSHSGNFRIWASAETIPTPTELRPGSSISANITAGGNLWYSVRTTADGMLAVETTGSTDTYLETFDSNYTYITEDDDSGDGTNARVELFVQAGQTYIFKLRGYSDYATGPTRIHAAFEPFPPDANNTARARAVPLRLGEPHHVIFRQENQSRWFSYNMARAGTLSFHTRGDLDTMLFFYDNNGQLIAENDDSEVEGEGLNARITQRVNPGNYFIEVRTYAGRTGVTRLYGEIR